MRGDHESSEGFPVLSFHASAHPGWPRAPGGCLTWESEGPTADVPAGPHLSLMLCRLSISFTAQLPRGVQIQRDPPAQQLQCL